MAGDKCFSGSFEGSPAVFLPSKMPTPAHWKATYATTSLNQRVTTLVSNVAEKLKAGEIPSTVYDVLMIISVNPTKDIPIDCKVPVRA